MSMSDFGNLHAHPGSPWNVMAEFVGGHASVTQQASAEYSASLTQSTQQFGGMGTNQFGSMTGSAAASQYLGSAMFAGLMQTVCRFFGFGNGNAGFNSGSMFSNTNTSCNNGSLPTWQPSMCGQNQSATLGARESLTWTRTSSMGLDRFCNGVQENTVKTRNKGQTASLETEKYKVKVAKQGCAVTVINKETGKVQTYTGDPHAKESSGRIVDFKGNLTVKLDDGNVLNIETSTGKGKPVTDNHKGPTVSNKVSFGNPREGFAKIENIAGPQPLKVSKLPFGQTTPSKDFISTVWDLNQKGNFINPITGKPITQAYMNKMDKLTEALDND